MTLIHPPLLFDYFLDILGVNYNKYCTQVGKGYQFDARFSLLLLTTEQ